MRAFFRLLFRLILRIFFRRIEVSGRERIPSRGPVIFVLNHPNGLIDPAFLLCLAPRRVSFLAKAPLFRMPVVGFFARAFEAIPVHRRQDEGADPARNRETFDAARTVLARGGTIAIFPEGASHSDPKLRPFKTGAARIALGAAAALVGQAGLQIVPAGLYYRAKRTFRSVALLHFGEPIAVQPGPLAPGAEPPAGPVRDLTARIERALSEVTLQAEEAEAHALVERAQRIFSAADEAPAEPLPLAWEFELRRRFLAGYRVVRTRWPERFAALRTRIDRYEAALAAAGLDPQHLVPKSFTFGRVARYVVNSLIVFALLLPVALLGAIVNYPAYRAAGFVATGVSRGAEDSLASIKVLAAMLLFPLSWAAVALGFGVWGGVRVALFSVPVLPMAGYAALRFFERLDRLVGGARALALFTFRRWAFLRLLAERRAIRDALLGLGREVEGAAGRV